MKKIMKKAVLWLAGLCLMAGGLAVAPAAVRADEKSVGYIVFGADLSPEQREKVMGMFDMDNAEEYEVSTCTNAEEHKAFDAYLDKKIIGTRAVSSIQLVPAKEGSGITVKRNNINYVTEAMYQNALISAGVQDVQVHVAAPFEVSGTCALLSAMNAYQLMSGEKLDPEAVDTAVEEIVTTGEVGDSIGDNDQAAELIAALKQLIAENQGNLTEDQLKKLIEDTAGEMKVTLDDDTMAKIMELLKRLENIDLNVETLKNQAGDLYNKVSGILDSANIQLPNIDKEQAMGFLARLIHAILKLLGLEK